MGGRRRKTRSEFRDPLTVFLTTEGRRKKVLKRTAKPNSQPVPRLSDPRSLSCLEGQAREWGEKQASLLVTFRHENPGHDTPILEKGTDLSNCSPLILPVTLRLARPSWSPGLGAGLLDPSCSRLARRLGWRVWLRLLAAAGLACANLWLWLGRVVGIWITKLRVVRVDK